MVLFEENDGLPEKAGTVIGAAITAAVYLLLAWTVLHSIV